MGRTRGVGDQQDPKCVAVLGRTTHGLNDPRTVRRLRSEADRDWARKIFVGQCNVGEAGGDGRGASRRFVTTAKSRGCEGQNFGNLGRATVNSGD